MILRYDGNTEEVPDNRVLTLVGDLTESSARSIIRGIIRLARENTDPVVLVIDSTGGETNQVFAILDTAKLCRIRLYTIGTGNVYSAGLFLLQIGHIRLGTRNVELMLHVGSVEMDKDTPYNTEMAVRAFKQRGRKLERLLAQRTGLKAKQIAEIWQHDRYFTARTARKFGKHGLIDGIVG